MHPWRFQVPARFGCIVQSGFHIFDHLGEGFGIFLQSFGEREKEYLNVLGIDFLKELTHDVYQRIHIHIALASSDFFAILEESCCVGLGQNREVFFTKNGASTDLGDDIIADLGIWIEAERLSPFKVKAFHLSDGNTSHFDLRAFGDATGIMDNNGCGQALLEPGESADQV